MPPRAVTGITQPITRDLRVCGEAKNGRRKETKWLTRDNLVFPRHDPTPFEVVRMDRAGGFRAQSRLAIHRDRKDAPPHEHPCDRAYDRSRAQAFE